MSEQIRNSYQPPWWACNSSQHSDNSVRRPGGDSAAQGISQVVKRQRRSIAQDVNLVGSQGTRIRPYRGSFRGVSWNAQALFSPDADRQEPRQRLLAQLAKAHDFVLLQETHSTDGSLLTWRAPEGYAYFHSHGSTSVAGVGILVDEQFLQRFEKPKSNRLEEIIPGRVGALRLAGKEGRIDLVVVYATTGDAQHERAELRDKLSRSLVPPTQALTVVAGDWNYVSAEEDRYSLDPVSWTGDRQSREEDHFQHVLGSPFSLIEFEQQEYTNQSSTGRARLDRAYANFGPDSQLDHHIACVALPWPGRSVSSHRPLNFRFGLPQRREDDGNRPIPEYIIRQPEWQQRVKLRHWELLQEDAKEQDVRGLRNLKLLKRAMREVSSSMQSERTPGQPPEEADRFSGLIRALRAWDQGRFHQLRGLAVRWNLAQQIQTATRWSEEGETKIRELRGQVMQLARETLVEEMRQQQEQEKDLPEPQRSARRQQLMVKLQRLRPGATTSLRAVRDATGAIHQEPEGMATALGQHWGQVFAGAEINHSRILRWMEEAYPAGVGLQGLPPPDSARWRVRRRDVRRAVRLAGNSAPGPDGIPYSAWRAMQEYGVDCLWGAMQELSADDVLERMEDAYEDEASCAFNLSLLTCIPKQTAGTTAEGNPIVAAEDTRPISMVDTANRLLANAARLRWEVHLGMWISPEQRGFLPGRSLIANVVELEDEAAQTALRASEGATMLLDFAAAFPSVSQQFLKQALKFLGFPPAALNLLEALYYKNSCQIVVMGRSFPGFPMAAGIRQGCPLSPLLFITAMDGLLRAIKRRIPAAQIRAFADDTAVVLQDLKGDLPVLWDIFSQLEQASGLKLNVKKCVLIPLGDRGPLAVKAYLERTGSPWFGVKVAHHGKYLGFEIGPEKDHLSWHKPIQKAWERVRLWDWSRLGLFYASQVYNIMILSLFSFIGQLEDPPPAVLAAETALLRKAAPGVGGWCRQVELHNLRRAYRFAGEFKEIKVTAAAAKLRVCQYENSLHGGLNLQQRASALEAAQRDTAFVDRGWKWRKWFALAPAVVLLRNRERLHCVGITVRRVEEQASAGADRPWTEHVVRAVRKKFQKTASQLIQQGEVYDAEAWIRRKLGKWGLHDRRDAARSLARLRDLSEVVPPRVMSAALGCVWNRWPTARRKQIRDSPCLLGCGHGEDSREHYAACRRSREAARKWLAVEYRISRPRDHWAFAAPSCVEVEALDGWWARVALLQYAVQQTTNAARAVGRLSGDMDEATCMRALRQGLIEGARGHSAARRLLRIHVADHRTEDGHIL